PYTIGLHSACRGLPALPSAFKVGRVTPCAPLTRLRRSNDYARGRTQSAFIRRAQDCPPTIRIQGRTRHSVRAADTPATYERLRAWPSTIGLHSACRGLPAYHPHSR